MFGFFVIFGFNLIYFHLENAIISSEKSIGQRIPVILSVFNILIHEVYRKFDQSCPKNP